MRPQEIPVLPCPAAEHSPAGTARVSPQPLPSAVSTHPLDAGRKYSTKVETGNCLMTEIGKDRCNPQATFNSF